MKFYRRDSQNFFMYPTNGKQFFIVKVKNYLVTRLSFGEILKME